MTRKTALLQAIQILSVDNDNIDITNKLEEIYNEMPLSTWTTKSIIDSIESYAEEHDGFLPYGKELKPGNGLPSKQAIFTRFSVSSIYDFFKQYFPQYRVKNNNNSPYYDKDESFFLDSFKKEYTRIRNSLRLPIVGIKTYNKLKKENTPIAETVMRRCNCKTYTDLLQMCEFKKKTYPTSITVNFSYDDSEDNTALRDIVNNIIVPTEQSSKK